MPLTITIPQEYGYVLLCSTATFILSNWHAMRVGSFRKSAQIPFPNHFATPEQIAAASGDRKEAMHIFNCAQRAHYNFLENYVSFLPALLIAGLKFPVSAAITGAVWSVFRIVYAVGYTKKNTPNGKGRIAGLYFWPTQLVLYGLAGYTAYSLL
ncbi:membrane-associated proteins in eicosanoid and glutathione metabolism [Eremomyces bilateralis CBS 781.70]|uniref:Membrane-associated proteins in eicosanoid and glutathione metabolism n=1 Tax=Eremomyces bilateralis CBS 781.70 TaxID=1392243 RepID=A0A6G1FTZ0_9PEZI|nr:membrane-associated proteins in eicosanoid and glutathione metabolism [Eremomyces bilateralis CBS 781.70]KAF1809176.1 membrane-associated proteins in eicosanoid and glutathione metabolism [Eremomyces bilateralis CBS 781.70]